MPSYYDSTKKKPGKATLKYKEGRKTKVKNSKEDWPYDEIKVIGRTGPPSFDKLKRELLRLEGRSRTHSSWKPKKEKSLDHTHRSEDDSLEELSPYSKTTTGRKPKKMAHGGKTVALGSGAARPQYFGKNG
tara:strand:- start:50 stop:442 length:393 start_codon:yes stop_codon:yes gene_type:complete